MLVNQAAIHALYVNFKAIFAKAFKDAPATWSLIATKVSSSTASEMYTWLGEWPQMREWIGDRQIKNLAAHDYTIKNRKFESTVGVLQDNIEDDNLGMYGPMFESMGSSAARFPDTLVYELLRKAFTEKCYDGQPFYSNKHKVGKIEVSNMTTAPLSMDSYIKARQAMMSLKSENEKSLNIMPNLLMVPPALESTAREILFADQINGTTNTYKNTAKLEVSTELAGNDTQWHLFDTTRPLKPLIYQERKAPEFAAKDKDTDDNVFMQGTYLYGTIARGAAGFGFWQMAYGSTGTGK